jgi:hypothetical protein
MVSLEGSLRERDRGLPRIVSTRCWKDGLSHKWNGSLFWIKKLTMAFMKSSRVNTFFRWWDKRESKGPVTDLGVPSLISFTFTRCTSLRWVPTVDEVEFFEEYNLLHPGKRHLIAGSPLSVTHCFAQPFTKIQLWSFRFRFTGMSKGEEDWVDVAVKDGDKSVEVSATDEDWLNRLETWVSSTFHDS